MTTGRGNAGDGDISFDLNLVGHTLEGRYRIVSTLGEGGMATVYLGIDERMTRNVVAKVPHPRFLAEPGFRERFEMEIRSLTNLEHPNVVKALDVGTYRGVPYAVLQYLGGGSLEKKIASRGGRIGPVDVLAWLGKVASALDYIHRQGMVHRDVKPGNVLFDVEENVFLADFGIAKALGALDTQITQTGMTPGSPPYMAPEAVSDAVITPSYDQYALACVVYQALSGSLPHEATDSMKLLIAKASKPPRSLSDVAPRVPPPVAAVVMQALQLDPEARWLSCMDFAEKFRRAVLASENKEGSPLTSSGFYKPEVTGDSRVGPKPPSAPPPSAARAVPATTMVRVPRKGLVVALIVVGLLGSAAVLAGALGWWKSSEPTSTPPPGVTASQIEAFLKGWAEPVKGAARDSETGFPSRIRRTKDGAVMALIPAGTFMMGAVPGDALAESDEKPRHPVRLSKAFYLDVYEVTRERYARYDATSGFNVGWDTDLDARAQDADSPPAHGMSHADAADYAKWASVSLPTEAQWERAAKGGRDESVYPWGNSDDATKRNAGGASDGWEGLAPVRSFPANAFGLHDLAGNVAEWCLDGYAPYTAGEAVDPTGPMDSEKVIARGGGWKSLGGDGEGARKLRVSFRTAVPRSFKSNGIGFRCAKTLP